MKTTVENKALARRLYNEVMNSHNLAAIKSFVTADFIDHLARGTQEKGWMI